MESVKIVEQGRHYTYGKRPSITTISDILIEVHDDGSVLYYDLFKVSATGYFSCIFTDVKYDEGLEPSIAAVTESKMIVEVHTNPDSKTLRYNVGHLELENGKINWRTKGGNLDAGENPSVAITKSNVVVAVHNRAENSELLFRIGNLDVATAAIEWNGEGVPYDKGYNASICVTDDDRVIEVHADEEGYCDLFYIIGKLEPGKKSINWVSKGVRFCARVGAQPSVIIDGFGVVMAAFRGRNEDRLYSRVGTLEQTYIAWHGENRGSMYDSGSQPALTYMPGGRNVIVGCHQGHRDDLQLTSMLFDTEVLSISFDAMDEGDPVEFASVTTTIDNDNGPGKIKHKWQVEQKYICSNTYNWKSEVHTGVSASTAVRFFGGSTDTSVEKTLTVGQSFTISKEFVWNTTPSLEILKGASPRVFTATLYRVPAYIPFTATFKRGGTQWIEKGSVSVTHGKIFANISSVIER